LSSFHDDLLEGASTKDLIKVLLQKSGYSVTPYGYESTLSEIKNKLGARGTSQWQLENFKKYQRTCAIHIAVVSLIAKLFKVKRKESILTSKGGKVYKCVHRPRHLDR